MRMQFDWMNLLRQFYLSEFLVFSQYSTSINRTPQIAEEHGYPLESHRVTTDDGYLLEVHRIPNPDKPVVFLMHCMFCSSAEYVCLGRGKALGFLLHDAGYDVWMGNARGNTYSRQHVSRKPEKHEFWDFSWHEIGMYDVPAMIDYTLATTGAKRLNYIGHSQGTTAFFVMTSSRPEYNDKIQSMQALAPIAFMSHCKSPVVRLSVSVLPFLENLASLLGIREFMTSNAMLTSTTNVLCKDHIWTQAVCTAILNLIAGYNAPQTNTTMLPYLFSNTPAGGSVDLLFHYGQLVNSGKFRQFDHGYYKNMQVYNTTEPPDYDLSKIRVPIVLHWSRNDWLADPKDVEILMGKLKTIVATYQIEDSDWAHLDFMWGTDANTLVYKNVINTVDKFRTNRVFYEKGNITLN